MSKFRNLLIIPLLAMLVACVIPPDENIEELVRLPTDAEVEQYNASVAPEDRIVCRREIPVGTNIPRRLCRMVRDVEETSTFHRDQLRRVLR